MTLNSKGAALRHVGRYHEAIIMHDRVLVIDLHNECAIGEWQLHHLVKESIKLLHE